MKSVGAKPADTSLPPRFCLARYIVSSAARSRGSNDKTGLLVLRRDAIAARLRRIRKKSCPLRNALARFRMLLPAASGMSRPSGAHTSQTPIHSP